MEVTFDGSIQSEDLIQGTYHKAIDNNKQLSAGGSLSINVHAGVKLLD